MSSISSIHTPVRYLGGALSVLWAILHLYLSVGLLSRLPLVGQFFIADSILALIAAAVLIGGIRIMFLPTVVFYWINYLLLTESRIFPAPVLGHPLPAFNVYVYESLALDAILIIVTTLVYITRK
ncbi:hypothetical protein [Metallosphaera hakonensis]|uniref:Uncharacterized protein n=1 Tax=Metallosphaera hakonensis JCM 8857 = DSM 7519 TaxID=1293036 RepID=A0A2U9IRA3_9CREN|nr:hypothetical protein [Metallosphaera hakonensis]AWR98579.1 hypothetical protein DFR87_01405 [Metallosphaera hakonensis JCM 8857 = DSM 7519]